jgi:FG-GAP repeat
VTGSLLFRFAVPNPYGARYGVSVNDKYIALSATLVTTSGNSQSGAVYVFSTLNGTLLASIGSPRSQVGGEFGYSTSLSESSLLVGAAQEDSGSTALAGNAYVFSLPV